MFAKLCLVSAVAAAATWTPAAMMKVKPVSAVVPSPDGQWAVWTETTALMDGEKSENLAQVYVGKSDGSSRYRLTSGEKSVTSPQWALNNKTVYFLREGQVLHIDIDGGEAEAVTSFKGSIGAYQLSPNAKALLANNITI